MPTPRLPRGSALTLIIALVAGLLVAVPGRAVADPADGDIVTFGDPASEQAHHFVGDATSVVDGAEGEKARVANPLSPAGFNLGDLRFTVAVDPARQNYLTVKFWGGDGSTYKTLVMVDGERVSYSLNGDYEPINVGTGANALPGRFFYATTLLPLVSTQGKTRVQVTLRTYHPSLTTKSTESSRKYYQAFTHTNPKVTDEVEYTPSTQVAPALTPEQERAQIDAYRTKQVNSFNALSAKSDASPAARLSIVRYQDELRFYAEALQADWSPAQTDAEKRAALERIFKSIDNFTKQYYGNVKSLGNGGHQSDWGGYYGALGEALYIVENLIDPVYGAEAFQQLLDEPFTTGTVDGPNSIAGVDWDGGPLTRGEAWERVLKANFDFARSRLSYIYNQMMYTYEGAWKAHEGLRLIGSRFYEGKVRSHAIVGESLGSRPFLGEEVLVGPQGEALDLYHSLFFHDNTARYTDDYLQVVMKGLAKSKLDKDGKVVRRKPYGESYTGITKAGLTRENTYVGNYGESANYLPTWFYRTIGHAGDEKLNDEILQLALLNLHARGQTRYQGTDANGNRIMTMHQVVDARNSAYPGKSAYGTEVGQPQALSYAGLEQYMADHADQYDGAQWAPYWQYAREAVGYIQQQLVDNQFFPYFGTVLTKTNYDLRLTEEYEYVTAKRAEYARFGVRAAGVVLPQTDLARYTDAELAELGVSRDSGRQFAWVDIDNLFVSVRDGDTHLFGALAERNLGYGRQGRMHVQQDGYDQLLQLATQGKLQYRSYHLRPAGVEQSFIFDQTTPSGTPMAMTGELAPIAYQPGIGTIDRDNFVVDNPYSGYPDLITARYGEYFIAINTTRPAHGNKQPLTAELPAGTTGDTLPDLVSGRQVRPIDGTILVLPETALVLKLSSDEPQPEVPSAVDVVVTTPGSGEVGLTWSAAAGARSYTISRATTVSGRYLPIASGVTSTSYVDRTAPVGTSFYQVTAVNAVGAGRPSNSVQAVVTQAGTGWSTDLIGATAGRASAEGDTVEISGGNGTGFGGGDDNVIYNRYRSDSLVMASKLLQGSVEVSAELKSTSGEASGIILRDSTDPVGRYVWLGAGPDGKLAFRTRSLDTRADIGTGRAGSNNTGGVTRSPYLVPTKQYDASAYRFVKLVRTAGSQEVTGFASDDGSHWVRLGTEAVPMVDVVHAGVAATDAAVFNDVTVAGLPSNAVVVSVEEGERGANIVRWNKPKDALTFDLYRTSDPAVAPTDPVTTPGWERLAHDTTALSSGDQIYAGEAFYKVVSRSLEGSTTVSADPAWVVAEGIQTALANGRAVPGDRYTEVSFANFTAELDAVEQAMQTPGYDEAALVKRIYDAYALLVDVYRHGFESNEPDVWGLGGSAPGSYVAQIADGGAHTGNRGLYFASTDTTGNAGYNLWFNSRKTGVSPIKAKPNTAYKVSFYYQLKDYVPGRGVGAYYFIRSYKGGGGVGTEQRNWLPIGDTAPGEWRRFERIYTTVDGDIDNVEVTFGFRGSSGSYRVDDVRVEPAG